MKFKLLIKRFKNNIHDHAATILGTIVAIATSWLTIDWKNFSFEHDWKTLILSAIIAAGGYLSKFKMFKQKEDVQ